jgi:ATP/maltotriose-dependent transcriptional regulator MalT
VPAERGDVEDAEALAREAIEMLAPTDYLLNQVSALSSLAGILSVAGRQGEADKLFAQARALALVKGSPILLERLGELEDELTHRVVSMPRSSSR